LIGTQVCARDETENWTTLLLNYWEIDGVFRVNISIDDIDL
jgi:hypothetical protein